MAVEPVDWVSVSLAALIGGVSTWVLLGVVVPPAPAPPTPDPADPPCPEEVDRVQAEIDQMNTDLRDLQSLKLRIEQAP